MSHGPDMDEDDEEIENQRLEPSRIQKLLSPLYIIIFAVFLLTACFPLWVLLSMVLVRLRMGS